MFKLGLLAKKVVDLKNISQLFLVDIFFQKYMFLMLLWSAYGKKFAHWSKTFVKNSKLFFI